MKDDKELREVGLSSRSIYEGRVLHLFEDMVRLPDGREAAREVIRHVGAVAVLPMTDNGDVLCVRQYRYAHESLLLEIPAGKLDFAGEDPESAARRELREETGAECEKLTPLGLFIGSPAILTEVVRLYLAEGLSFHAPSPDEDEFLEVVRLPLKTLVTMALTGEIEDGKTQTAILKVAELLRRRGEMA